MCYFVSIKSPADAFLKIGGFEKVLTTRQMSNLDRPVVNGFDYGQLPVFKSTGNDGYDLADMEWGFIPRYIRNREELKTMRLGGYTKAGKYQPPILMLNAIGEDLLEKPAYKQAAREHRCLVLISGFYEWRHIYPLNKKTGQPLKTPVKYPYYIDVKKKDYSFLAGIWSPWTDRETGEYVESLAIVTTRANKLMEQIHNSKKRMPVILTEDLAHNWIRGAIPEPRIREIARFQYPWEEMSAYPIARDFLTAANPRDPFKYAELPALESA
jgi:putative SOS response-associated peptidase YedK